MILTDLMAVIMAGVLSLALFGLLVLRAELNDVKRENAHLNAQYLMRSGIYYYAGKHQSYRLFSRDGGKRWYVIENDEIIGTAEEICPGLLEEIGFQEVIDHVRVHTPAEPPNKKGRRFFRRPTLLAAET